MKSSQDALSGKFALSRQTGYVILHISMSTNCKGRGTGWATPLGVCSADDIVLEAQTPNSPDRGSQVHG